MLIPLSVAGLMAFLLSACQTTLPQATPSPGSATWPPSPAATNGVSATARPRVVGPLDLKGLPETIRIEHQDRVNRLARLSRQFGAQAPSVQDDLQVDAGTIPGVGHAVPVIRVRYDERTFFDFDKAEIRPEAGKILDVLAESMKRDLPDTSLLILGHTDSVGSNDYNARLSLRRAEAVMIALANRGVNVSQMGTVGIGESQPIATNATEAGRALNRRVEFMISRFADANIRLIEETPRNAEWLDNHLERRLDEEGDLVAIEKDGRVTKVRTEALELRLQTGSEAMIMPSGSQEELQKEEGRTVTLLKETTRIVRLQPADTVEVHLLPESDDPPPSS